MNSPFKSAARNLIEYVGNASAWNMPCFGIYHNARKVANQYGTRWTFSDGSAVYLVRGTAKPIEV